MEKLEIRIKKVFGKTYIQQKNEAGTWEKHPRSEGDENQIKDLFGRLLMEGHKKEVKTKKTI